MASPQEIANDVSAILPNVNSGTLRSWGQWFGRPYDNVHQLVECHASDDCLRLHFDGGEALSVWNPSEVLIDESTFRIGSATALRWTSFYYGRPKTPENLCTTTTPNRMEGSSIAPIGTPFPERVG